MMVTSILTCYLGLGRENGAAMTGFRLAFAAFIGMAFNFKLNLSPPYERKTNLR